MSKRKLILTARIELHDAGHTHIGVFQNHGKAGVLCVDTWAAKEVLMLLNGITLKDLHDTRPPVQGEA